MLYLQVAALKIALKNDQLFSKLQHHWFTDPIAKKLYHTAKLYFMEKGQLPSFSILKSILETESEFKLEELNAFFDAMEKVEVNDNEFDVILTKLRDFYEGTKIKKTTEKLIELLSDNKIILAKELLLSFLNEIHLYNPSITEISLGRESNLEKFDEQLRDTKFCIPTGYKDLDKKIGGFSKHEFIVISAKKGTGKSTLMLNFAINNYMNGYSPVYINIELSEKEWMHRLLSNISGISMERIKHSQITLEERIALQKALLSFISNPKYTQEMLDWYDKNMKNLCELPFGAYESKLKQTFAKKYFKPNTLTCLSWAQKLSLNELIDKISTLKKSNKCDIIYIDYINLLYLPFQESLPYWEKLKNISEMLKMLAKNLELPIVTAAQMDEHAMDTRYSRAITEACDIAFSWKSELTPEEEEEASEISVYKFFTIKSRNIPPIKRMIMEADFDHHRVVIRNG